MATYRCRVSNANGTVTSNTVNLSFNVAMIAQNPSDQNVPQGGTATFSVEASGSPTLVYQWEKDDVPLTDGGHYAGAATSTLTVSNVDSSDEGGYRCVVTNCCGSSTTSSTAGLILAPCSSGPIRRQSTWRGQQPRDVAGRDEDSLTGWCQKGFWHQRTVAADPPRRRGLTFVGLMARYDRGRGAGRENHEIHARITRNRWPQIAVCRREAEAGQAAHPFGWMQRGRMDGASMMRQAAHVSG